MENKAYQISVDKVNDILFGKLDIPTAAEVSKKKLGRSSIVNYIM
jgi:hypothetical protein